MTKHRPAIRPCIPNPAYFKYHPTDAPTSPTASVWNIAIG